MRFAIPILLLATLPGCGTHSTRPVMQAPAPAPMAAESAAPCERPTPLRTLDLMAMALKANETMKLLNDCAVKHAHAVNAYIDARQDILDWNAGKKRP